MLWERQPEAVMSYLKGRLLADLAALEGALSASQFLLPSGLSVADISCAVYMFWLADVGIAEAEAEADYPNLRRCLLCVRSGAGFTRTWP
jgi:glutathione S-transferase